MPEHQTIIVTQNNSNDGGCLSGCGTVFALMLVVGLVVTYWYVAVPVAVVAVGIGVWLWSRQPAPTRWPSRAAIPVAAGPLPPPPARTADSRRPATSASTAARHSAALARTAATTGSTALTAPGADRRPTPLRRQRPKRPMHRPPARAARRPAPAGGERLSAAFLLKVPALDWVRGEPKTGSNRALVGRSLPRVGRELWQADPVLARRARSARRGVHPDPPCSARTPRIRSGPRSGCRAQAIPAPMSCSQISAWATTSTPSLSALAVLLAPTLAPQISRSVLAGTDEAIEQRDHEKTVALRRELAGLRKRVPSHGAGDPSGRPPFDAADMDRLRARVRELAQAIVDGGTMAPSAARSPRRTAAATPDSERPPAALPQNVH